MKPVEITVHKGVRNDLSPERFDIGDLVTGNNIELDETGKTYRRLPTQLVLPGVAHSLWGDSLGAYGVLDDMLGTFDGVTHTPITAVQDRVAYARIISDLYWTDGVMLGVIANGSSRRAGIEVPHGMSASIIGGTFRAGRYLITMTYVRDGREGGAHTVIPVDVPANSGIELSVPNAADGTIDEKRIYISAWNGALPMLVATLSAADTLCTVADLPANHDVPVRTQFMGPMPAGQLLGYFNGRLYVAQGNYLWYSQPYEYELCDLSSNYIGFKDEIRTFAPMTDGVYIGTENETMFLAGMEPSEFVRRKVADYGTVLGTEREVPGYYVTPDGLNTSVWLWTSRHGVCMGLASGEFKNLTGGRYILPDGVSAGASLLKVRGGTPQFVTTLF